MKKTLYKLDKKGKLIEWTIENDDRSYWTTTGQVGGKLTKTLPTYCEGKNVGRANETTVAQQVELEVASKVKKQMDLGYTEEKPTGRRFDVSLAAKYVDRKEKGRLDFPYIYQPKLDGLRCYIRLEDDGKLHCYSRNHKEYLSVPHLLSDPTINSIFEEFPDIILDGELYNHNLKNDFNKIVSLVKKTKPTDFDRFESSRLIYFNCFDCFFQNQPELPFITRNKLLMEKARRHGDQRIAFVTSASIGDMNPDGNLMLHSEEEVESKIREYIEKGYEGIMLKKDVPYFFGRSNELLKYKFFKDEEYKLVGIEDGKGNLAGIASIAWLEDERGVRFKAGITGNQDYARNLFITREQHYGKMATVKYQELTPLNEDGTGGVPRFGKMISIRDYE